MKNTQRKTIKSYISIKQRITAAITAVVMLAQICIPTVALATTAWGGNFESRLAAELNSPMIELINDLAEPEAYKGAYFIHKSTINHTTLDSFYENYPKGKPAQKPKLIGDSFVQTRLIRAQYRALMGRYFFSGVLRSEDIEAVETSRLYENAKNYADANNLILGNALANALPAQDMIWPELKQINGKSYLVPVVHLSQNTLNNKVAGHLIEFDSNATFAGIQLDFATLITGYNSVVTGLRGIINNQSSIKSPGNLTLSGCEKTPKISDPYSNSPLGNIHCSGTIANLGGTIDVAGTLDIYGKDVINKTLVVPYKDKNGEGTRLGRVANVEAGSIQIFADGNIEFIGASAVSDGKFFLNAANNINIVPLTTHGNSQSQEGHWKVNKSTTDLLMSRLAAEDTLSLIAGGVINITASELISTSGGIELLAGEGIHILDELEQTSIQKQDRKGKTKGTSSEFRTEAVRAILNAGKGVLLDSEHGDVVLRATQLTSTSGTEVYARNGKVHLLMTKELEEFHLQTTRKGSWTIKTRTEDVVHENNIQNAIVGGLQVQAKYGINVEYTGKEGATLKEQIEEYRKMPEMKWMAELYDQALAEAGPNLNWEELEEIHKELKKTKRNLSPAAMAIIAIAVCVAMGPAGAGLMGSGAGAIGVTTAGTLSTTAAVLQAGALTLATQAAQSLASGNNLRETISAFDSSDNLRSLAVSMATAGAMSYTEGLKLFEVADTAGKSLQLASQAAQAVTNAAVNSVVSVAINGGNSKDYLNAFNSALITSAVNSIGNKLAGKISNSPDLGVAGKYITHAALGCAAASVTAKVQDSDIENACASGAGGAVISQVMADVLKSKLDDTIARATNGTGSVLEVGQQIQELKQSGADVSKLISGLFAFALGGDVNASADAGARVARSNAYRYASTIQVAETLYKRAGFAQGTTFAERMENVYEEEARLYMDANGVSKSMQDSLLQKARDAGVFKSVGQYDAAFTGDAKMFEDAVSKRQEATYNTSFVTPDDLNLETLVSEPGYGDIAQPVFNFFGATDRLVNTLSPAERAAASFLISAASGGFIKTALVTGATVGASKFLPEGMPNVPELAAKAGVGFILNRDFDYVSEGITYETEDPIDIETDGYGMNEAVNGFAYLIENVAGIRFPVTGNNGKSIVQNSYGRRAQNSDYTIGANRIHPIFKSMDDFYNAAKTGGKRILIMGNYSHYKNGEFIKHNDGKLGEKAMVDVLKGATGVEFKAIQNLSGHGPDGVYIDKSSNPATIYLAEAKSSISGADAAKAPTGSATARLDKWIADYEAGKYDNAGAESIDMLRELKGLRDAGVQSPVKGIWVQVDVPPFNSSVQGLNAIINVW